MICCSRLSIPSRIESSERDMVLSWELGSRFREIARWRSRRESLMWSARRKSWDGLAMFVTRSEVFDFESLFSMMVVEAWSLESSNHIKAKSREW